MRKTAAALVSMLLYASVPACAGDKDLYASFYETKKNQDTHEAFLRATEHLKAVTLGMPELEFLEAMHMAVLGRGGKPYDATIDGYLFDASRDRNLHARKGERFLVFGYMDGKRAIEQTVVVLRDHRVREIVGVGELGGQLASAGKASAVAEAVN